MEKSNQPSFLKSLALAFGDGLAFGVAVKLAQGPSKTREELMTDLGPLAERLRKVEDHKEQSQLIDREALTKFGEGLDGRVLEKVIVALEARLNEHAGQVDRRLAEIDAQVALDLKAVDTHTAAQTSAVEKAIQQIEAQVRDYVTAAQQSSTEQIAAVDQRLSALHEALPAKFREIIEAVRQSMEARVSLELTELEGRVAAGRVAAEQLHELEAKLRGEVEALSGRLSADMHGLAEHHQNQTAPLQQALQQLETKLTTLREELPPKIRQIVEAVESSMEARISAGDQQAGTRMAAIEEALGALRKDMPTTEGYQAVIDESLRRHAEQVGALDQKLTVLQEELPPKIKAIVDAVRESLDARMALELKSIEEQHHARVQQTEARISEAQERIRQQLAAESKTPAIEEDLARLRANLADVEARLDTGARQAGEHLTAELQSLEARHHADIEQVETRLRAERAAENITGQIRSAVDEMAHAMETRLANEIRDLAARRKDYGPELEKALQYASLLEARVQALEHKLHSSAEETVERAVERVWQALEVRLQERAAQAPAPAPSVETITGLRQKSTSAEQSVLDLIAGIGQLFEKPAAKQVHETPPPIVEPAPVAEVHVEPEPAAPEPAAAESTAPEPVAMEPVAAVHVEPEPPAPVAHIEPEPPPAVQPIPEPVAEPVAEPVVAATATVLEPEVIIKPEAVAAEPDAPEPVHEEPVPVGVAEAVTDAETSGEPKTDEKPPVILFKPKEAGRKWRIPFVSSFLLMALAIAWLEFM